MHHVGIVIMNEGVDAWVIGLRNESTKTSVLAYVNGTNSYYGSWSTDQTSEEPSEDDTQTSDGWQEEYANNTRADAIDVAIAKAGGEGWTLVSTDKGTYEGVDVWVIALNNPTDGVSVLAYVNGTDCYFSSWSIAQTNE